MLAPKPTQVVQANKEEPDLTGPVPRWLDRHNGTRVEAIEYLTGLTGWLGIDPDRWRSDVIESPTIVEGVANYAAREGVDIIVMNDQRRKGLAKLAKRSIAKEIQRKAPIDVRIFRSGDLVSR